MEPALKSKIDKVKRGLVLLENKMTQFYKPLNANVRNIKTNFFEGSEECYIQFTYGFGPSEQTKRMEFPYVELDEYLERFEDKKDLTGDFSFPSQGVIPKTNSPQQKEEIKIETKIMSEQKNNMASLRDYLFGAIEAVKNNKMTTEQARSTAQLAQTVINSVKLELDYKKSNSKAPQLPMLD